MAAEQHVFIIGSKGIPAKYGGFETFVEKLTENRKSKELIYHVACMEENSQKSDIDAAEFEHNDVLMLKSQILDRLELSIMMSRPWRWLLK